MVSQRMKNHTLFILLRDGRWRVSLAAALAAVSGALVHRPAMDGRIASVFLGVVLVALACTWVNQIQERRQDALMRRTGNRPLVKGLVSVRAALCWACGCMGASLPFLLSCGGWTAVGTAFVAVLLYNSVYTGWKGRSPFALLAGALAGAAPPVLGWVCSGGPMLHRAPTALFLLFLVWQVPHFWLAGERLSPDYEDAGLPAPWRTYRAYGRLLFLWIAAFSLMLLALPALGLIGSGGAKAAVLCAAVFPLAGMCRPALRPRGLFHIVNLSMAAACVILAAEGLCRG